VIEHDATPLAFVIAAGQGTVLSDNLKVTGSLAMGVGERAVVSVADTVVVSAKSVGFAVTMSVVWLWTVADEATVDEPYSWPLLELAEMPALPGLWFTEGMVQVAAPLARVVAVQLCEPSVKVTVWPETPVPDDV